MPDEKQAPVVRVRTRGQIGSTLERFAKAYRAQHPERATRYVYDPQHKPELSKVMEREASGFSLVRWKDLGLALENIDPESTVRVADLVLMSVDVATWKELGRTNAENAKNQLKSVQSKYYEEVEKVGDAYKKEEHSRPGTAPIGSAQTIVKKFEYDVEQRTGEGPPSTS